MNILKTAKWVLVLCSVLALTACFTENNALIGKWKIDAELLKHQPMGPIQYNMTVQLGQLEFTKTSVVRGSEEIKVSYKTDKNRVGVVANILGSEETDWYTIVDNNTITYQSGQIIKTFRRVQ